MIQQTLRLFSLVAIILLGITTQARAGTEYWLNLPWGVYAASNNPGTCYLMTRDEANSGAELYSAIHLNETGPILTFTTESWDIKDEKITGMSIAVQSQDDQWTTYQGVDWDRINEKTIAVPIESDFLEKYAAGRRAIVLRDRNDGSEAVIVAHVNLTGSGTAISKLRNCVRDISERNRREAERERIRPSNPF
ncbi:hypothetical protein GCM10009093_21910 [Brevundimonas terrae]|uniref:Uncharacterized protein n=1 Tax=Brevundimonas terrae TaxID=363631 RepID=A0ABN0YGR7_9CAUL|nr:hypothetical protein [Brevundimonas terrae]NIJ26938.1 hypothetical protein [Brevundimonas terrae]